MADVKITRTISEPYVGPYALFTDDELRIILHCVPITPETKALRNKAQHTLDSDPKLREPHDE